MGYHLIILDFPNIYCATCNFCKVYATVKLPTTVNSKATNMKSIPDGSNNR